MAAHFLAAKRVSPLDDTTFRFDVGLGLASCMRGAHEEAVAWLRGSIREVPNWTISHSVLIAGLAYLERGDETTAARADLRARQPGFRIADVTRPFRPSAGLERIVKGLRRAGLTE